MRPTWVVLTLFAAGAAGLLAGAAATQQPDPGTVETAPDSAVDPQTRGPLHEAFAEPTSTAPQPGPIVPKQPPEPIEEMPPDQKPEGSNVQWIPGYWTYDDETADFLWVSGFWRDVPPDHQWVPGYWAQADTQGWQRVPGYWAPVEQTDVEYLPTPPRPIDAGPSTPAPAAEAVYVPGCWVFHTERYLWRPGFWINAAPGWVYTPPRYCWTPVGYIFVDGYWDYPLETRGLAFCPVEINRAAWRRGWVYRPRFAIGTDAILTALFVRPAFHSYYFGDYFNPGYARAGYVAWTDYHVTRGVANPLFGFYRARLGREWETSVRQIYVARREGTLPPPPATFQQQAQVIQNITNVTNNTVQINRQSYKVTDVKALAQQMTMVAPLAQVAQVNPHVKLQAVPRQTMAQVEKHVAQLHQVAHERQKFDVAHVAAHPQPTKAPTGGVVRPIAKLTLPKVTAAPAPPAPSKARPQKPPPPPAPKPVAAKPPEHKEVVPPRLEAKPNSIQPRPERPPVRPPTVAPKEEKTPVAPPKLEKPPVVSPKTEKTPVAPPKLEKPPVVPPKLEKPPVIPPKLEKPPPKEEKTPIRPPVVPPKLEKPLPKEEKLPVRPPVVPPKLEKPSPKEEKTPIRPAAAPPGPPAPRIGPEPPRPGATPPRPPAAPPEEKKGPPRG